jgi:hypothetical protein
VVVASDAGRAKMATEYAPRGSGQHRAAHCGDDQIAPL